MVKKVGPAFGELYYGKELNWSEIEELARKHSEEIYKVASTGDFLIAAGEEGNVSGASKKDQ